MTLRGRFFAMTYDRQMAKVEKAASCQVVCEGDLGSSSLCAGYAATLTTSGALGSIRRRVSASGSSER